MAEISTEELVREQQKPIIEAFEDGSRRLGVEETAVFKGFYYQDSNARAKTGAKEISYNIKYLGVSKEEKQRVMNHELQHVQTSQVLLLGERPYEAWAFVFHPSFGDLHARMKAHFEKHKAKEYPFRKNFWDIPEDYDEEMVRGGLSYDHFDEVLALLRGYELFLLQSKSEIVPKVEPYEFIEAFVPEDLKFLDPNERAKMANEVIASRPGLIPESLLKPKESND